MFPVFPFRSLLMLVIPVGLAALILAVVGKRGSSVFKKQGVAWGITLLMVFAAIGIGYAKAPFNNPKPEPAPSQTIPPASVSCVRDDAGVLSDRTVKALDERNDRLWNKYHATIGVVTCNYAGDDPYTYVTKWFADMRLGSADMIVVLDIGGEDYWMYTGDRVAKQFSGEDCSNYTWDYMEGPFARGDYDTAVLQLTEMLEAWYGIYYF